MHFYSTSNDAKKVKPRQAILILQIQYYFKKIHMHLLRLTMG